MPGGARTLAFAINGTANSRVIGSSILSPQTATNVLVRSSAQGICLKGLANFDAITCATAAEQRSQAPCRLPGGVRLNASCPHTSGCIIMHARQQRSKIEGDGG